MPAPLQEERHQRHRQQQDAGRLRQEAQPDQRAHPQAAPPVKAVAQAQPQQEQHRAKERLRQRVVAERGEDRQAHRHERRYGACCERHPGLPRKPQPDRRSHQPDHHRAEHEADQAHRVARRVTLAPGEEIGRHRRQVGERRLVCLKVGAILRAEDRQLATGKLLHVKQVRALIRRVPERHRRQVEPSQHEIDRQERDKPRRAFPEEIPA